MRGYELQHKTRARVAKTRNGEALTIRFSIGPFSFFIIAGLPNDRTPEGKEPAVYVKINTIPNEDWELYKDHGE